MVEFTPTLEVSDNLGRYERHIIDMDRGLRSGPGTEFRDEGKPNEPEVFKGDTIDIYPDTATKDSFGHTWCKVIVVMGKYPGKRGWMNMNGLRSFKKDRITGTMPIMSKPVEQQTVETPKVEASAPVAAPPAPVAEPLQLYIQIQKFPMRLTASEAAFLSSIGIILELAVGPEGTK